MTAVALALLLIAADPGTTVFPLLKIGQGCRASAMGESFTGLANDASTVYWNPAGLGVVAGHKFALSHHEWFSGFRDEVGHASLPLGPGALGLGLVYTGQPNVRYWDAEQKKFDEFNAWAATFSAGYGWRLGQNYTLGLAATGMYEDLKPDAGYGTTIGCVGYGGGLDLGATGRLTEGLSLGLAARHLGGVTYGDGFERLPAEFALGASYAISMFNLALDAVVPALDANPNIRAGIEFTPVKPLALRLGYRTGPVSLSSLGFANGLTAGLGVSLGNFGLDYAFVPYGELGLTHRVGLRLEVPPPTTGAIGLVVLDAETGQRLPANLALSGACDTTATGDELMLTRVAPGELMVRANLDEYEPLSKTLTVQAGRRTQDTLLLRQLKASISGGVYDAKTGTPIGGKVVYSGTLSGEITIPAATGKYEITSLKKGIYYLEATGPTDEYLPQTCTLKLAAGEKTERDFNLWKKGDLLYLMVNFETGKADILPQFTPDIDRVGLIIKQTPQIKKIELSGHTDPRDIKTPEFPSNWELSQARADAVKKYLVEKFGIDPNRIVTKGYADTKPIAPNTTPEGMYKNRRTELKILE